MAELIKIIYRYKYLIVGFTLFCSLASVIISSPLVMSPYYRSFSEFYPVNPGNLDRTMLFKMESGELPVHYYGTNNDINRVLAVARSSQLAAHLIDKFDLIRHYDIDTIKNKTYTHDVFKEFFGNYKASKTSLSSIEISILDTNPQKAADIINEAIQWIDRKNKSSIFENTRHTISMLEKSILNKKSEIKDKQEEILKTSTQLSFTHKNELSQLTQELVDLKKIKSQNEASILEDYNTLFVVEYASPAERKHKPVRWLIVSASTLFGFLFSIIVCILTYKISITLQEEKD